MSQQQVTEFNKLHQSSNPLKTAATAGISSAIPACARSIYWRIFFGLIPVPSGKNDPKMADEWISAINTGRAKYASKKEERNRTAAAEANAAKAAAKPKKSLAPRFGDDSDSDSDDGVTLVTDDPLSSGPNSEYSKKFEHQKMIELIDKDMSRLWGDIEFFEDEKVKRDVKEILIAYTSETDLKYRQGMHEIASLIYYVVHHDAQIAHGKQVGSLAERPPTPDPEDELPAKTQAKPAAKPSTAEIKKGIKNAFYSDSEDEDANVKPKSVAALLGEPETEELRKGGAGTSASRDDTLSKESRDSITEEEGEGEDNEVRKAIRTVCDPHHVVADTVAIFSRVLHSAYFNLAALYDSTKAKEVGSDLGASDLTRTVSASVTDNDAVDMVHRVQGEILKRENPALWKHMNKDMEISPPSYGIRWIRLLFLREFPFAKCFTLWDALFGHYCYCRVKGSPFQISRSLVPDVAAAMLLYIGGDLLDRDDYAMVLHRLMKYPPVEDIGLIVKRAIELREDNEDLLLMVGIFPKKTANTAPPPGTRAAAGSTSEKAALPLAASTMHPPVTLPPPRKKTPEPMPPNSPAATKAQPADQVPRTPVATASGSRASGETVEDLRQKQLRMGMILSSVIDRLETKWFPEGTPSPLSPHDGTSSPVEARHVDPNKTPQQIEEDYILAIAELKKVKDVLLNTITE